MSIRNDGSLGILNFFYVKKTGNWNRITENYRNKSHLTIEVQVFSL